MLPEFGIVITIGTIDIADCHLLKQFMHELKAKQECYMVFNNHLKMNHLGKKVTFMRKVLLQI